MTNGNRSFPESSEIIVTEDDVIRRKQWLEFCDADEILLTTDIDALINHRIDALIASMYEHFLKFEDTRSYFPNTQTLNSAQVAQKTYFQRLTKGNYDAEYVVDRLRVGTTHYNIELGPNWYLGAYSHAIGWIFPLVVDQFSNDVPRLKANLRALLKIIFFDMELAIESYISAKEGALRKHRDALRELETERRVTKSILESAPVGIVSLDAKFTCVECNDEFVDIITTMQRPQIIGKSLFDVAPGLNVDLFTEVLTTGQPANRTADMINICGDARYSESYWDWATWPVKDDAGKISGLVAMFTNATDRVQLQQQREDFVATLTHDLKTPVSATNRAVSLMLEGDFGEISPEQREVLETILQSNTTLYSLVQTLLDVYRFDSGVKELNKKNCHLSSTITQLVTEIMPLARDKGVELRATLPSTDMEVYCDEEELRRVVQNLIDNSLKFTPTGGSITVRMSQTAEQTEISVEDTGRGIPPENMPKLFQRFWQAGSTGRYYASTGLGLYLCKRILEAHGGKIWCTSHIGQGSKFCFSLPNQG